MWNSGSKEGHGNPDPREPRPVATARLTIDVVDDPDQNGCARAAKQICNGQTAWLFSSNMRQ
jgi:hypothetical protein